MRLKYKKECLFFLLFSLLIFGIFQYSFHKIFGMVYYPDEFGYWASAANWIGYDWSSLTALNSYYSFGYSLLLAPILKVCSDSVTAYRAAIALNMLLQAMAMPMLYGIFRRLFLGIDAELHICAVGIALFYPVWIFYGQVTLAEGILFFLYIGIAYLMVRTVEKARIGIILLLTAAMVYLCFVHMRTVGMIVAAVIVFLCWLWKEPAYRKKILTGFGFLAAGGILGMLLRFAVLGSVYGNTSQEILARNDITGQLSRIAALCSAEGMIRFLCGCAGKMFYLGAASFGTAYYALFYMGRNSFGLIHKMWQKKRVLTEEWISLFLLLSFAGQFLITAIYMNHPRRADEVVYGRYNDYLLPVFIGIGFLVMYRCCHLGMGTALVIVLQSIMLPVISYGERLYGGNEIQGYFMAGIGYLVDDLHFDPVPDMAGICLLGNLLILLFSFGIWIIRGKNLPACVTAVVILAEIIMGTGLHHKYTYKFNELIYMEVQLCEYIDQREADLPIAYLYGGGITYIDVIQFNLPGRRIQVIQEEEFETRLESGDTVDISQAERERPGMAGYLIVDIDSTYRERIEKYMEPCSESAYFVLYECIP